MKLKPLPTNVNSITVKAQRKLTFNSIGTGTFTSNIFGESWPQVIEKAVEADVYRLPDCYVEGYPIIFSTDANGEIDNIAIQETGYKDDTYGMTFFVLYRYRKKLEINIIFRHSLLST